MEVFPMNYKNDFLTWLENTANSGNRTYPNELERALNIFNENYGINATINFFTMPALLENSDFIYEFYKELGIEFARAESEKRRGFDLSKVRTAMNSYRNFLKTLDVEFEEVNWEEFKYGEKSSTYIQENLTTLTSAINRIYFGAPGTGKSYGISEYIKKEKGKLEDESYKTENDSSIFRTTFHPEYTYHDFVGQIMPKRNGDEINYEFVPQMFTKALEYSFKNPTKKVFLILEELSRANVAAVFGDIFQLLDRNDNGASEYRINNLQIAGYFAERKIQGFEGDYAQIYIPGNLYLIGTANTSDQNVFVMDTAFKRRFEFEYIDANVVATVEKRKSFERGGTPLNDFKFELVDVGEIHWIDLYLALNEFITSSDGLEMSEDKQLGQFFLKFKDGDEHEEHNFNQVKGKLLQYLWEDVQGKKYGDDKSLFLPKKELARYSDAYRKMNQKENVFSKELLDLIGKYRKFRESYKINSISTDTSNDGN